MPYSLKLKDKKEIARDTMAFYFEKPRGFAFAAGQSMRLSCPGVSENKTFSISSAPHEEELVFAMRMRDSLFKKALANLKPGAAVEADGPFGERFVLHRDTILPAVFIAGGIGITPLLSMLSHIAENDIPRTVTLFYSNRRKDDIAFLGTLKFLVARDKCFKMVLTLTKPAESERQLWSDETGYINKDMLERHLNDIITPMYYISGPPEMVVGMSHTLEKAGVHLERILTKKFSGY
ncbi:FAD-dependent oxidoreductase [Patescibacteria group bacterium]|nr:FAD-dependent oxidoreductase [Patescibacteria group bacterium]